MTGFGGGLRPGRKLKAVIPAVVGESFQGGEKFKIKGKEVDMLDCLMISIRLFAAGSMSGSSAIIVMDNSTDIVQAL